MFRELTGILDETIGFLRQANPEAALLVFSVSGMGSNCSGLRLLPEVLERIGMGEEGAAEPGRKSATSTAAIEGGRRKRLLTRLAASRAAEGLKHALPTRFWDTWTRRIMFAGSGWARCRAFCLPNDYSGAIRVNLRGREPKGRVAPGAEYEAVCEELTAALTELEHLESGRPVVGRVIRPQALYHGELTAELPDLLVIWANEEPVQGVRSSRVGTIEVASPERRLGGHRPHGFLVAHGPRIVPSKAEEDRHILDLAPTILGLLGVPLRDDYEGRPISMGC
jgi:predicted AlkP superfamily phosphohydrolase/phosphomutase